MMFNTMTFVLVVLVSLTLPSNGAAKSIRGKHKPPKSIRSKPKSPKSISRSKPNEPTKPSDLDFFFFGDWGSNKPANESESGIDYEEAKVATQVNLMATKILPKFIAPLGDNFYDNGVTSTTDPLWDDVYRSLFTAPATFVPWYPVFGNHDYYLTHTPQPQIDYYKEQRDSRWTFPDYQYSRKWNIPGSSKTMEIIFINTVSLCPEVKAKEIGWPANPNNAYPNPNATLAALNRLIWQPVLQWIENALAASTADLLLVAGHYHVYTNTDGDNVTPEGSCLQDRLVPLLKKYGVTAYLNGHEHNFEHILLDGISYFTAGHGSDKEDPISTDTPVDGVLFNLTIAGFASAKVKSNSLKVDFIDYLGNKVYSYTTGFNSRRRALLAAAGVH